MPEQAYTPPETKYEVHIDELMKAIRGEPFEQGNGLWRMRGEDIDIIQLFEDSSFYFDKEQEYIILNEAIIKGVNRFILKSIKPVDYGIGFIFCKSIIPHIELRNAKMGSWYCNNTIAGNIDIEAASRVRNITISNNSTLGYVKVNQSEVSSISVFENCQVISISVVRNSKCEEILISDNTTINSIRINRFSQTGDIWIQNNTPPISIDINSEAQTGKLICLNANLNFVNIEDNFMDIELVNTTILRMTISRSMIGTLNWGAGTKGELYISGQSKILHLPIATASLQKDSVLSLSDTLVRYFVLEEAQIVGSLLLRKISAASEVFAWRNITTYLDYHPNNEDTCALEWQGRKELLEQQLEDYQAKVAQLNEKYGESPLFRITHSSLGKTEITGCDFSGFQFQYYNSNLLGCFITGTKLPKDNIFIYSPSSNTLLKNNEDNPELFEQKTAIYNQFKKIYENQGDVVEASWYHAKAMANQQCLLKLLYEEEPKPRYKKMWGERSFELIGFRLNRFSNNHGESWRRAIRFVLLFSLIFYSIYYWSIHYKDGFELSWDALGYFWGDYFSFLDITHRIDFHVPKEQLNGWSKFLDYFGKLVIGYGLYQLIAAFRRHGKKGG